MNLRSFFEHFLRSYTYELVFLEKKGVIKKAVPKIDSSLVPRVSEHVQRFIDRNQPTRTKPVQRVSLGQDAFRKIVPLLNDASVSDIECSGPGQPLSVVRYGRKEITRVRLSKEEIDQILKEIAEQVHIPLLEGIFRATTERFHIDAVVSDTIGSRFVISKIMPAFYGRPRY